jgi:hypothetical protein
MLLLLLLPGNPHACKMISSYDLVGVKRRPSAGRCASSRQKQQPTISKRNSLLYELFDDGWGVEVAGTADKQPASESNESAQSLTAAQQGRVAKKGKHKLLAADWLGSPGPSAYIVYTSTGLLN